MEITATTSDTMVLRSYFFTNGEKAAQIAAELKALTADDKAELVAAIRATA